MNLIDTRKKVNNLLADLDAAKRQRRDEQQNLQQAEDHLTCVEQAQVIVQQVAQAVQQQAHSRIAGVVSKCLETVFGGSYGFKIHFERKRGRTEARLVLLKDGNEIDDPLNADSGGVIDVAAFALRLACLVLAKPSLRRIVVLDEPFKFVDEANRENVRQLLEGLAEDMKMQFVVVTHIKELQCGKVVDL